MRKTSWVAVVMLVSSFILVGGSAEGAEDRRFERGLDAPRGVAERLPLAPEMVLYRGEPGGLEGVLQFDQYRLYFSALRLGKESAEARFWSDDGTFVLESRIESRQDGWIRSGGVLVSGRGEIGAESRRMLDDLAGSIFGEQLSRVSLELGCRLTGRDAAPVLAAVVQPWQVIYKHTGRLTVDAAKLELSRGCDYRAPVRGRQMVLTEEEAVAYVPLYTTLDAEGAAPRAMTAESTAPCGARCRGACGADCSSPLCSTNGCEFICPTHSFCRFHDGCYDGCNATYGCWSPLAWACRRECDERCTELYSSTTCAAWSQGFGPSDGWGTYNECGSGSGGDECNEYEWIEVVKSPGITVEDGFERDQIFSAIIAGGGGTGLETPRPVRPDGAELDAFLRDAFPTRDARREWREWGPDSIVALACDDGGGGGGGGGGGDGGGGGGGGETCTHCSCQGEYTSWEGEVCGSTADELVDECWNSCY